MQTVGAFEEETPSLDAPYSMLYTDIYTLQVGHGRSVPQFERYLTPHMELPAVPYPSIAEADPEIHRMCDTIRSTVLTGIIPPLHVTPLSDSLLLEIHQQARPHRCRMTPHSMLTPQEQKTRDRKQGGS